MKQVNTIKENVLNNLQNCPTLSQVGEAISIIATDINLSIINEKFEPISNITIPFEHISKYNQAGHKWLEKFIPSKYYEAKVVGIELCRVTTYITICLEGEYAL